MYNGNPPTYCTISLHRNPRPACSVLWVYCVLVCLFVCLILYMYACMPPQLFMSVYISHKGMLDRQRQRSHLFYIINVCVICHFVMCIFVLCLCSNFYFASSLHCCGLGVFFNVREGGNKEHLFQLMYFWIGGSQVNNKTKVLLRAPATQWGYVLALINGHMQLRPLKQCRGSGRRKGGIKDERFDKFSQPLCTQSISPHIYWQAIGSSLHRRHTCAHTHTHAQITVSCCSKHSL